MTKLDNTIVAFICNGCDKEWVPDDTIFEARDCGDGSIVIGCPKCKTDLAIVKP